MTLRMTDKFYKKMLRHATARSMVRACREQNQYPLYIITAAVTLSDNREPPRSAALRQAQKRSCLCFNMICAMNSAVKLHLDSFLYGNVVF